MIVRSAWSGLYDGALVTTFPEGPAMEAGMEPGDVDPPTFGRPPKVIDTRELVRIVLANPKWQKPSGVWCSAKVRDPRPCASRLRAVKTRKNVLCGLCTLPMLRRLICRR